MAKRIDDVFDYICTYARENNGITPPVRQIASDLRLSASRIQSLMVKLKYREKKIEDVGQTKSYKVVNAEWELRE